MFEKLIHYKLFREFPVVFLIPLLICSYFSVGFHHFDEHFQILEFANYKMGYCSAADLPWEFGAQIRPTLQPWITVFLWKIYLCSLEFNPYHFAFFLRFLTAVLSVIAMVGIRRTFIDPKDAERIKWYYRFSFLLWFMPFVMVRYSSETWSALFLAYGLVFTFSRHKIANYIIAGILFACSFWFRFQIAFALFGLALWILMYKLKEWQRILGILIGFTTMSLIFYKLDGAFYQSSVFTPYQYYYYNIVLKVAENFGTFGLWYYPVMAAIHLIPPISLLVEFLILKFLYNHKSDVISWIIFFFLMPHFFISHKEFRFLFPLFVFLPYTFVKSMHLIKKLEKDWKGLYTAVIVTNFVLLTLIIFKPADIHIFNLKQLSDNGCKTKNIFLANNYKKSLFPNLTMNYYLAFDTLHSPKIEYQIDTTLSGSEVIAPFLIQKNTYKYMFLTKMGDDFEKFKISKVNNPVLKKQ
jgi:phosphatidylinositol glycan class B